MSRKRQPASRSYDLWTFEDDNKMLDLLVEQVNMGNRMPSGVWKHEVYLDCVNKFNEDTANKKTVNQLKNRTRSWKKTYQTVKSCFNTSGFDWDATTHRVTACPSVWQEYIKNNKDIEKYRQQGCPLYEKLALVVGNSIAMGAVTGTNTDMASDVQCEKEDSTAMLEDVDLGRDTPSPFFAECEEAPKQSPSANSSTSSRRRKKPEMSTDDCFVFADTMKEIVAVLRDTMKPAEVIVTEEKLLETNLIKAISEISNIPIKWKFCTPEWFDTSTKKQMFIEMTVEERFEWLQYCSNEF